MDFQNQYDSATNTIDEIVSTQLTSNLSWKNVPGSLVKASSSPGGYVWGFNDTSNLVFACPLPCTGNWSEVDLTKYNVGSILDLTTDYTNVYILLKDQGNNTLLLIGPAIPSSNWVQVLAPLDATSIFSTSTYIWVQDTSGNKNKCAKPCTTGNWVASTDKNVKITSSSYTYLYGVDGSGNAFKTDENMTTGWAPIAGLADNKWKAIIGQGNQMEIYGIDTASKTFSCGEMCAFTDDVRPVDTAGYTPLNLTDDPQSKNLWMTTTTPGDGGNIFVRTNEPNYSNIMNQVDPLDQTRDKVVTEVEDAYKKQVDESTINKQVNDIVDFFTKMFKFSKNDAAKDKQEMSRLHNSVEYTETQLNQMTKVQPIITVIIITLGITAGIYLFGSVLGGFTHSIAAIVLIIGLGYAISLGKK
jgi:hypothetical protein